MKKAYFCKNFAFFNSRQGYTFGSLLKFPDFSSVIFSLAIFKDIISGFHEIKQEYSEYYQMIYWAVILLKKCDQVRVHFVALLCTLVFYSKSFLALSRHTKV